MTLDICLKKILSDKSYQFSLCFFSANSKMKENSYKLRKKKQSREIQITFLRIFLDDLDYNKRKFGTIDTFSSLNVLKRN